MAFSHSPHQPETKGQAETNDHFSAARAELAILGRQIEAAKGHTPHSELFYKQVQRWMQLKNMLNMLRVCQAFYTGSLFYEDDPDHPESSSYAPGRKTYSHLTTSDFEPLVMLNCKKRIPVPSIHARSYILPDGRSHSTALETLLVSKTVFECGGSHQVASYLTLMDLLRLFHGDEQGRQMFDGLYKEEKETHPESDLHKLRIGAMQNYSPPAHKKSRPNHYAPIYSLTHSGKKDDLLAELRHHPEQYQGLSMYIDNHPAYLEKHPSGASTGWNTVFAGLDPTGNPLFLLARYIGKKYLLTYQEVIQVLNDEYNLFPRYAEKTQIWRLGGEEAVKGLLSYWIGFDPEKIKLLISDPKRFKAKLVADANDFFEDYFQKAGYVSVTYADVLPTLGKATPVAKSFVRETRDDCHLYKQPFRLFGARFKKDFLTRGTQDDCLQIRHKSQRVKK